LARLSFGGRRPDLDPDTLNEPLDAARLVAAPNCRWDDPTARWQGRSRADFSRTTGGRRGSGRLSRSLEKQPQLEPETPAQQQVASSRGDDE
jgi:hypothetical protein